MTTRKSQEARKLLIQREQAKNGLCVAMGHFLKVDTKLVATVQELQEENNALLAETKFLRAENEILRSKKATLKKAKAKLKKQKAELQALLDDPDELIELIREHEADCRAIDIRELYGDMGEYH